MRYVKIVLSASALLLLLAACGILQPEGTFEGGPSLDITTMALEASVIDFEGLDEGYVVDMVSHGMGISGFDAGGFVGVLGVNPGGAIPGSEGGGFYPALPGNAAIIFDATCGGAPAGCSGGEYRAGEFGTGPGAYVAGNGNNDDDLYNPAFGNVLIIAENLVDEDGDGLIDDPDDADVFAEAFFFDFSTWDGGSVVIGSLGVVLDVQDVEAEEDPGAQVVLYSDLFTTVIDVLPIPVTGDGNSDVVTALVNYEGVVSMTVDLQGSGAIDNITFATDIPDGGGEGCTPGYWKNHSEYAKGNQADAWIATGYDADDSFDTVFGVGSSFGGTLYEAVTRGGGGEKAFGRHAVAALLNAASTVDYLYSEAEVIAMVQLAYAGGQFEGIKNLFELQNEMGCPLN